MSKIAILTSKNQWFVPYAKQLKELCQDAQLFYSHKEISSEFSIVFILAYHKIIESTYLKKHQHNIVIHESNLPQGKGWSPMFWQILEGKNKIIFSMFEASDSLDAGNIYMKKTLHLNGNELNKELRHKQANLTINMCLDFLNNYDQYKMPYKQVGDESFYPKRTPKDSLINITRTIDEEFNLLRIVDNEDYPAYFYKNGTKYLLKIEKVNNEDR